MPLSFCTLVGSIDPVRIDGGSSKQIPLLDDVQVLAFQVSDLRLKGPDTINAGSYTDSLSKEGISFPERGTLPLWSLTAPTSQSQEPSPPWLYCSLVANELSGPIRFMMLLLPSHSWRKSGNHNSIGATLSLCLGGGMLEYTRYCNASIKPLPTPWRLPENAHSPSAYWLPTFPLSPRAPSHNQGWCRGLPSSNVESLWVRLLCQATFSFHCANKPMGPWVRPPATSVQLNALWWLHPWSPSHWHSVSATKMFSPLTTYTYSTHHAPRGHLQNFLLAFFCGDSSHISHPWQCRQKPSVEGAWSFICLVVHGLHSNSLSSRGAFLETGYARWFWQRQQWKYGLFPRQPAKCRSTRSFTFTRTTFASNLQVVFPPWRVGANLSKWHSTVAQRSNHWLLADGCSCNGRLKAILQCSHQSSFFLLMTSWYASRPRAKLYA